MKFFENIKNNYRSVRRPYAGGFVRTYDAYFFIKRSILIFLRLYINDEINDKKSVSRNSITEVSLIQQCQAFRQKACCFLIHGTF